MRTLSRFNNNEVKAAQNIADNEGFGEMFDDWVINDPKLSRLSMETLFKLKQRCAVWFIGGIATGIQTIIKEK